MDRRTIATLSPERLAQAASHALFDCLEKDPDAMEEIIRALLPSWRMVETLRTLEYEVRNGGFHQFFWNSRENCMSAETAEDLEKVGAREHSEIFARALILFAKHDYDAEKGAEPIGWESFHRGNEEGRFRELDEAFWRQNREKSLSEYLGEYIKANPELYTGIRMHTYRGRSSLRRL